MDNRPAAIKYVVRFSLIQSRSQLHHLEAGPEHRAAAHDRRLPVQTVGLQENPVGDPQRTEQMEGLRGLDQQATRNGRRGSVHQG